jgi:hypothetical protein
MRPDHTRPAGGTSVSIIDLEARCQRFFIVRGPKSAPAHFEKLRLDGYWNRICEGNLDRARLRRPFFLPSIGIAIGVHFTLSRDGLALGGHSVGPDFALQSSLGNAQLVRGLLLVAATFFQG